VGDFSGLQIALSSLYAQRKALDVTGQNLANVNTEGYSRQRVTMTSDSGPLQPAIFSRWTGAGGGVRTGDVQRLRDQFLELRGYQEHAQEGELGQLQVTLGRIEQLVNEPSDDAIAAQLADFWAGWDDVANRPDDLAARSQLIQRGVTLAAGFQELDASLGALRQSNVDQVIATVDEINAAARSIADLNRSIQAAVNTGLTPNDLMDQRDVLIAGLASKAGVTVRPNDAGTVDVFVGATALVRGTEVRELEAATDPAPPNDELVRWTSDQSPAAVGGRLDGLLQSINDVIPRYRAAMQAAVTQATTATNTAHAGGFDLNGSPGVPFFVTTPTGFAVNPLIVADPRLVAAAGAPGTLDGSVARALAATTGPDATYRAAVTQLGVEAQTANRRVDTQAAVVRQIDAARDSEAGVNLDEEMTNMVMFQHAYDAAARFMTTIDSVLDTLINHTGVG
jgi:flagellar hook-associated protein 1 FlgK